MKLTRYIDIGLKEARKSNIKHKYSALLLYKGKIIAKGHNHLRYLTLNNRKLTRCLL